MGEKSVPLGVLSDVAIAKGCSKSNPRFVRPWSVVRRSVPRHAKPIEMIIFLGWNCFVRPLMQVAGSDGMMMQMPATPMRCG